MRYAVKALLEKRKSGPGMLYTPTLEISSPAGKDINVGGAIKYAAWKVLDINLAMKGLMKTPITLKGNKPDFTFFFLYNVTVNSLSMCKKQKV